MKIDELFDLWYNKAFEDKDLKKELDEIKGKDSEVYERFYKDLEFGTAGARGVIGAGTNRMNIYNVRKITQGLANYLSKKYTNPKVAIAYDSRIKSDLFAKETAKVLAENNVKVYLYEELMPVPVLSFTVRTLHCNAGVVITSSHNPSKYNGYKVYGKDGAQMALEETDEVINEIKKIDIFNDVKVGNFEKLVNKGSIKLIGNDLLEQFLDKVEAQSINKNVFKETDLKVIYTPLNGTGNKPVKKIFDRVGFKNISIVKEQENPDGNFTTCSYPNPGLKEALELGIRDLEQKNADLLIATDPDADRVNMAVRDEKGITIFNGNEIGMLIFNYICEQKTKLGLMPKNPIAVKSIVTTNMINNIGKDYGVCVKEVLTGFKFIGEVIYNLEKENKQDSFIFGCEESYGFLTSEYARDKDAIAACMLICEMASFYKKENMSLVDVRNEIYKKYGYDLNLQLDFLFEGSSGMKKLKDIMENARKINVNKIAGYKVVKYMDYLTSKKLDVATQNISTIDLPKSNVLTYVLENNIQVIVRPSGTEPKIKLYISINEKNEKIAKEIGDNVKKDIINILGL